MGAASWARFVGVSLASGTSFLTMKVALEGMTPLQVVAGRLTLGAAVLGLLMWIRRLTLPRSPAIWAHLVLLSFVAILIPFTLYAWAEQYITSGLAGLLSGATPLFTVAFAALLLPDERLSPGRAAGLVTGFAGLSLMLAPSLSVPSLDSLPAQLACLGAAACYGLNFVYIRRFLSRSGHDPTSLAGTQLIIASIAALLSLPLLEAPAPKLTGAVLLAIAALGLLSTGVAYALYYRLIADEGATTASLVTYVMPFIALILGVVFLSEPVTWNLVAGGAVLVAGVGLGEGRLRSPGRHEPGQVLEPSREPSEPLRPGT